MTIGPVPADEREAIRAGMKAMVDLAVMSKGDIASFGFVYGEEEAKALVDGAPNNVEIFVVIGEENVVAFQRLADELMEGGDADVDHHD